MVNALQLNFKVNNKITVIHTILNEIAGAGVFIVSSIELRIKIEKLNLIFFTIFQNFPEYVLKQKILQKINQILLLENPKPPLYLIFEKFYKNEKITQNYKIKGEIN